MNRRSTTKAAAANIKRAAADAGVTPRTLASAVDMDRTELEQRLNSEVELSLSEVVRIGGALRVSAGSLLRGVA